MSKFEIVVYAVKEIMVNSTEEGAEVGEKELSFQKFPIASIVYSKAVVLASYDPREVYSVGVSVMSAKDNPCKKTGRVIASQRAIGVLLADRNNGAYKRHAEAYKKDRSVVHKNVRVITELEGIVDVRFFSYTLVSASGKYYFTTADFAVRINFIFGALLKPEDVPEKIKAVLDKKTEVAKK